MIIDENFHDLQEKVGVRVRTIHTYTLVEYQCLPIMIDSVPYPLLDDQLLNLNSSIYETHQARNKGRPVDG